MKIQVAQNRWVSERDCDGPVKIVKVWQVEILDEEGQHIAWGERLHPTRESAEGEMNLLNELIRVQHLV